MCWLDSEKEKTNPYIPIEEEIISMLDESNVTCNEPLEEADNVQIDDVLVDRVGFKDVENT